MNTETEHKPFTIHAIVLDHEMRIRALEKLAWKLVGGVIVGTAVGTTIGGAVVTLLVGR